MLSLDYICSAMKKRAVHRGSELGHPVYPSSPRQKGVSTYLFPVLHKAESALVQSKYDYEYFCSSHILIK